MGLRVGQVGQGRRRGRPGPVLAALTGALLLAGTAMGQDLRGGSALAGVEWPQSGYDWADEPGGPRQSLLEQGAGALGAHCGATREFFAWNLEDEDNPDGVRLSILSSYEAAGWALTQPAIADQTVYLATRGAHQLAVRLYAIPERQALALFSCALQAEEVTPAAVAEAAIADRAGRAKQYELPALSGIGLGALALALGFLLLELRQRRRVTAAAGWTEVPAVIAGSAIKKASRTNANDDEFTNYTPVVRYTYRYAGVDYESKRLRFGSSDTSEREDAEAVLAAYPPGATVTARVNPAKPREATLLLEPAPLLRSMLPSAIFALIGGALLLVARGG